MMKKPALVLAVVLAVVLGSCAGLKTAPSPAPSDQAAAPESTTPAPEPTKPKGGDEEVKEFVFATLAGNLSLDPVRAYTSLESQIYTAIYEGLVIYNPVTLEPMPGAARRWEVSEDKLTYRFFLREDGRFSNGDPVTAKVFRDSWFRMLDPTSRAEYSTFFDIIKGARDFRTGKLTDPAKVGIRVAGDYLLDVELEHPADHFLKVLCHMAFVPIHPFYIRDQDWEKRDSIVGNGPFYIYSKSATEIELVRNNLYWDRAEVPLDRIIVRFMSDPAAISEGFNQGKINWATNWDSSVLDNSDKVVFNPLFATSFFFFRSDRGPWKDGRVRRALALLVPWENIRNDQIVFPTARLVPKVGGYPDTEAIDKPNREEALRLLAEAGFPEGRGLPALVLKVPGGGDTERIASVMQGAWKETLGLDASIVPVDSDAYFAALRQDDYTIGQMTWIGDFFDPMTFLQMWTSDSNLNDARYSNLEYDQLVREAAALSGDERYQAFGKAESLILRTAVIMPISHQPSLNLIDLDRVEGWFPNPLDIHPFKFIGFKGPRMLPNVVMRGDRATPAGL